MYAGLASPEFIKRVPCLRLKIHTRNITDVWIVHVRLHLQCSKVFCFATFSIVLFVLYQCCPLRWIRLCVLVSQIDKSGYFFKMTVQTCAVEISISGPLALLRSTYCYCFTVITAVWMQEHIREVSKIDKMSVKKIALWMAHASCSTSASSV